MRNRKSVIYVNYSPYENSGKILDYLLENFDYVFLFSLGFYNLKNKKRYNTLFIYKKKKLLKKPFPLLNLIQIKDYNLELFVSKVYIEKKRGNYN